MDSLSFFVIFLYTLLGIMGPLGLIFLGIRRERIQIKRDYKEAVKLLMAHGRAKEMNSNSGRQGATRSFKRRN